MIARHSWLYAASAISLLSLAGCGEEVTTETTNNAAHAASTTDVRALGDGELSAHVPSPEERRESEILRQRAWRIQG